MTHLPDIDQLLSRIREEAQKSDYGPPLSEPLVPLEAYRPSTRQSRPDGVAVVEHVNDLLAIGDNQTLIDQAYLILLKRPADTVGRERFMQTLLGYGRPFVLCALRFSPEGREINVNLPGFGFAPRLYRLWTLLQRRGLGHFSRWPNLVYHRWRRMLLALDTRLIYRMDAARNQLEQDQANLDASLRNLADQSQQSGDALAVLAARVKMLQLAVQPIDTNEPPPSASAGRVPAALAERIDAFYLAFEERMRGPRQAVSESLAGYLPDLTNLPQELPGLPVLDIGAGRGEWLKLLGEHGFAAEGVEINALLATQARAAGLDVRHGDAGELLRELPSNSRAAITAFHVVEHLPFPALFAWLEQCWRVLAPGGLLILETPNPENLLVGAHTFWHDFSHQHPMTPTALEFLVRFHGFAAVRLRRLHPYPADAQVATDTLLGARVSGHLYGPQDYALLANKPDHAEGAPAAAAETGAA